MRGNDYYCGCFRCWLPFRTVQYENEQEKINYMKLKIENWIESSNFSDAVTNIFSESVMCYKNGVYRPALLLSYISFMNILRERILISDGPKLFEKSHWEQIQKEVVKDETWEKAVFDATQQREKIEQATKSKKRDAVFSISETIREQISYWKNRRNDCAHFKSNHIDAFHVEAFWAFLQSNLPKITIEGGKDSLINKFKKHFDITYTPANADETNIIKEIEHSVNDSDLEDFWKSCFSIIDRSYEFLPSERLLDFIEKTILNSNEKIKESVLSFIEKEKSLYHSFLSKYPNRILLYNYDNSEIRRFWKRELLDCEQPLEIYATLLNSSLIPTSEITEANEYIVERIKRYEVKQSLNAILVVNNFTAIFENRYFKISEFQYYQTTNGRAELFYGYFLINGFNKNIVEILCSEYNKSTYFSEWLLRRLERLFTKNSDKKQEFLNIATENSIEMPEKLKEIIQKNVS